MSEVGKRKRLGPGGWAWLLLIGTPAVVILSGVVAMFVWQVGRGGVTPKWRKPIPSAAHATNRVDATPSAVGSGDGDGGTDRR